MSVTSYSSMRDRRIAALRDYGNRTPSAWVRQVKHCRSAALAATESSPLDPGPDIGEAARPLSPDTPDRSTAPPSDTPITEDVQSPCAARSGQSCSDAFGDPAIAALRDLQRKRKLCISQQSRMDRATESYIVSALGGNALPKGERKKMYSRAAAMMNAVALEEAVGLALTQRRVDAAKAKAAVAREALSPDEWFCLSLHRAVILLNERSRSQWDQMRGAVELEMRALARTLPSWPFVEGIKGASDLTLAVIVAEAGDPTAYSDKHTLWKRLGIGVIDGRRQGNPGDKATAEDWIRHGYNKKRRAEMWAFLSDTMMRGQWQPNAGKIGPYGEIYARKKIEYLERYAGEKTMKSHADKSARRYASQCFIRDVRKAWNAAIASSPTVLANAGTPQSIGIADEAA